AHGQRIAVGDLIISRRNDSAITIYDATRDVQAANAVRNGYRWEVKAIDTETNRIAARRLSDGARAVFERDYVREHITHGYAVTVHSAQGVTADTADAVLSETSTRTLPYVAMTRGRDTNTTYLYERTAEDKNQHGLTGASQVMHRGSSQHAARLLRAILANDEHHLTAIDRAAATA
ncbi:MAG TPA: AAA family ATPase, partial [Mycobacterium sp.]|nr:AAA family ATPase [Mycobacterium sp.]